MVGKGNCREEPGPRKPWNPHQRSPGAMGTDVGPASVPTRGWPLRKERQLPPHSPCHPQLWASHLKARPLWWRTLPSTPGPLEQSLPPSQGALEKDWRENTLTGVLLNELNPVLVYYLFSEGVSILAWQGFGDSGQTVRHPNGQEGISREHWEPLPVPGLPAQGLVSHPHTELQVQGVRWTLQQEQRSEVVFHRKEEFKVLSAFQGFCQDCSKMPAAVKPGVS